MEQVKSRIVGALACAAVVLPGIPGTAASAAPKYGAQTLTYKIPTRSGTLHAEVVHATLNGKIAKLPSILTISPYSALGRNGDAD
ncbi:MAG TPA: hypothetical protein VHI71_11640, partial [Actinomycetota bacterium]|nr:hypothetical protein [Actinomycetota bacterium]